ncbi:MICOS complex subunit Mic19-like [Xenia sp. Carnegie-2017]|uniref:MICOS complex subunit Mic19-like n=1 Tax=Xenia sp. Carnegie-2017 TaxID=2897299 RepID=UPI001F03AB06|nr:MICOS complex subunit Mic19-like [Xenia sp. Carnegie-2017]
MGAQESSRRVTVENEEDDDSIGIVKISESLLHSDDDVTVSSSENISQEDVKKLWHELLERKKELDKKQERIDDLIMDAFEQGQNMAGGPVSYGIESLEKTLDEKERELDQLREKTRMYQEEQLKKNDESERKVLNEFDDSVQEMRERYSKKKATPVCSSLKQSVLECYQANKNRSLKCSQLVQDYVKCVEEARQSMAKRVS